MEQHDRKIIRGLTLCSDPLQKGCVYETCPYEGKDCITRITGDALNEIRRLRRERAEFMKKQEAREQCLKTKCVVCPHCDNCDVDENGLLKAQEAKWIPVSERLPEEEESIFAKLKGTDKWHSAMFEKMSDDVRVVVVFADGTRRVSHSYTVDGKWECEKSPLKRTVTHWMQNPELPKDGEVE